MNNTALFYLSVEFNKAAAMVGGGMFNSGMMRGGMGVDALKLKKRETAAKFKSFNKSFRPPRSPFSGVAPAEMQRLVDLRANSRFGGDKIVGNARNVLSANYGT